MKHISWPIFLIGIAVSSEAIGQEDSLMLAYDEAYVMGDAGEDPTPDLNSYSLFNNVTGGDSVRMCGTAACSGWIEDAYPGGALKHRGFYDNGKLTAYKNYHPNGALQCEFKGLDATKSVMRTWHPNGKLRSETKYADGFPFRYDDYYVSGELRYCEERHRTEPCFLRMELYAADGKPVSLLKQGRSKFEFEQEEYYPTGVIKCKGGSRYDRLRHETMRVGTWTYFNHTGVKMLEEDHIDGKVSASRKF